MDVADFEALYADNWRAVLAYAVRRVSERADAADVTAEVFTIAWRRRDDIPRRPDARLWLYGVARRVVANQLLGKLRRARLGEALRCAVQAAERDPVQELVERDRAAVTLAALRKLPERQRELLTLTVWEGLTPAQAARVLRLSPGAARVYLHRARTRLRAALGPPVGASAPAAVLHAQKTGQPAPVGTSTGHSRSCRCHRSRLWSAVPCRAGVHCPTPYATAASVTEICSLASCISSTAL